MVTADWLAALIASLERKVEELLARQAESERRIVALEQQLREQREGLS